MQILKDNAVKVLHSIFQQIWKTWQLPEDWKSSVFFPIPKKGNAQECSNYRTIGLISHTSTVILKFLQARLQQYVNCEIPDAHAGFRKGRGIRDIIANVVGSSRKQENSRKPSTSALLIMPKPFNCLQFSSVTQSCPSLCDPMNHSIPGLPVHHQLPESTQTNVH